MCPILEKQPQIPTSYVRVQMGNYSWLNQILCVWQIIIFVPQVNKICMENRPSSSFAAEMFILCDTSAITGINWN